MSLHSLRQAPWLRSVLAALLLCFTLGTLAHAGHRHETQANGKIDTHFQCDYCHSFGGLMDAPQTVGPQLFVASHDGEIAQRDSVHHSAIVIGLPQARAPPTC